MGYQLSGNKFVLNNNGSMDMYNALGGNAGANDNFFTKRAKSVENALGTTLSVLPAWAAVGNEDRAIEQRNKDYQAKMNDVYKQFGFNGRDDYEKQLYAADDAGNQAEVDRLLNLPGLQSALQTQASANKAEADTAAKNWQDFRENSYVGQKTNQDQGKFLGSAINTLSTATDVLGLTNGPVSNAIQGGIEGIADELEQNGLQNFDWGRAGQNALTGAASGAAVGLVNKGLSNSLAKNGGNLFSGGNKLTQGLNNLGSKTAVGRGISTLATGAGRGAISGAVGGATGAGLQSALNGVELGQGIANTFQGAAQGAGQGALAGTAMAGANMALNKTPLIQKVNQANQDWQNSGDNFKERWNTTRAEDTWGNRLRNRGVEDVNAVKQGFKNVGEGLGVLAERGANKMKEVMADQNGNPIDRLRELKTRRDVNKVLSGESESAQVTPKGMEELPVEYTNEVHQNLLRKHPDEANKSFINGLEHIETMRRPDYVYENSPRDVQYRRLNVGEGDLAGRVSVKPYPDDNASYINTAHLMSGDEAIRGVPTSSGETATLEDFAFKRTGNVDANSNIPQNGQNVNVSWDNLAKESGFADYNDMTQKFTQANPGVEVSAQNVLDWADSAAKSTFTQAKTGKQIKNERAIVEEILGQFRAADKPTVRATKPAETFYSLYNKLGLSDGDQIRQAVHYADPGELVPTIIRTAAGKAGVVDLTDAQALVSELKLNKRQNYTKTLNVLEDIIDSTPSTISGGKNGVDALELQRTLEKMSSDAKGTNGTYHIGNNVVDQTTAKNLDRIASNIGENLDKAAAANGAVEYALNKYSNEIQQMRNAFPNNQKWQAMVDNEIAGATTIKQLRSSIKDLVRASIFIDSGDENMASFGGRMAAAGANIPTSRAGITNKLLNTAVDKVNSTPLARNLRLKRYEKNVANNETPISSSRENGMQATPPTTPTATNNTTYNPAAQIYNAIGRTEGEIQGEKAAANYITEAANNTEPVAINNNTQGTASTAVYDAFNGAASSSPASSSTGQTTMTSGDYYTDLLGRAMQMALDDNNAAAYAALLQMYQEAAAKQPNTSTEQAKLTDKQRQANAAAIALDELEQLTPDTAYNLSDIPVIGGIATLGGNSYETAAKSLAQQVGYMLSGANVTKDEAENIGKAYVPLPRDNETIRQQKLNKIRGIISEYQRTYSE